MSSFYPGIMNGGGGSSSADYDKIINAPVKNIGSSSTITNLSLLDVGHYNLKGAYKTIASDEIVYPNESYLDVLVLKDTATNNKVVQFFTVEDSETYINIFIYDGEGNLVKAARRSLTAPSYSSWEEF